MKNKIKIFLFELIHFVYKTLYIFPVKNKVLVSSFQGKGYSDSPRYIAEKIHELNENLDICCVVSNSSMLVPAHIKTVKKNSLRELYEYATSKIIINNTRFPLYITKRKEQFFVGTWHGCFPLKKIGFAMENITELGKKLVTHDNDTVDLFISGSKIMTDIYRRDFQYTGPILECGLPRHDAFFDQDKDQTTRNRLGINKDDFVLIYAPTFRDNHDLSVYDIDYSRVKEATETRYGKTCKILTRFHPNMSDYANTIEKKEWLIDVTKESDIYSILRISDLMITDYSGLAQEFSYFMKRPVILYAKDMDNFERTRGTYYRISDLPYPVCLNNNDLISAINTYDMSENKKFPLFFNNAGFFCNGQSSLTAAKRIISETKITKEN